MPFAAPIVEQRLVLENTKNLGELTAAEHFAKATGDVADAVLEGAGQFAAAKWRRTRVGDAIGANGCRTAAF